MAEETKPKGADTLVRETVREARQALTAGEVIKGVILIAAAGVASYGGNSASNEQVTDKLNSIEIKLDDLQEQSSEARDRLTRLETRFEYWEASHNAGGE